MAILLADLLVKLRADASAFTPQMAAAQASMGQAGASAQQMGLTFDAAAGRWRTASGQFASGAELARAGISTMGTAAKDAQSPMDKLMQSMATMAAGRELVRFGMETVGAIGGMVDAANKWNLELQRVHNNTTLTTADMGVMAAGVKALSASSGANLNDLAEGFMHIGNYGFSAAESLKILTPAMQAALATGSKTADTANVLAETMHEFGIQGSQAAVVMNLLHVGAADGAATLQEFATGTTKAINVAASLHVSLSDTVAALSTLTQSGQSAKAASDGLTSSLFAIANPTAKARDEAKKLSDTLHIDLAGDFSTTGLKAKGLGSILLDVHAAMTKLGSETSAQKDLLSKYADGLEASHVTGQKFADAMESMGRSIGDPDAAMLKLLPNVRAFREVMLLTGTQFDSYESHLEKMAGIMGGQLTPVQDAFAKQQLTLQAQLDKLTANFQLLSIGIGELFIPTLTRLAQAVVPVIKSIVDWTAEHPMLTQALAGAAVGVGVLAVALGGLAIAVGAVGLGLGPLGIVLGAVATPLLAIGAAVGALYLAWQTDFMGIRESTSAAWAVVKPVFDALGNAVSMVSAAFEAGGLSGAFDMLKIQLGLIGDSLGKVGAIISGIWSGIDWDALKAQLADQVGQWAGALWGWVQDAVPPVLAKLAEFGGAVVAWLQSTGLPALQSAAMALGGALWQWVVDAAPVVIAKLGILGDIIGNWITTIALPMLGTKLGQWSGEFGSWLDVALPKLNKSMGSYAGQLGTWMDTNLPIWRGKVIPLAGEFGNWLDVALPKLRGGMTAYAGQIGNWMDQNLPEYRKKIEALADQFGHWMDGAVNAGLLSLQNWLGTMWGELASETAKEIKATFENFKGLGGSIVSGIKQGVEDAWGGFTGWFGSKIDDIPLVGRLHLGSHSPSMVFAAIGDDIVAGLQVGLDRSFPGVIDSATGGIKRIVGGVTDALGGSQDLIRNAALRIGGVPGQTMLLALLQSTPGLTEAGHKLPDAIAGGAKQGTDDNAPIVKQAGATLAAAFDTGFATRFEATAAGLETMRQSFAAQLVQGFQRSAPDAYGAGSTLMVQLRTGLFDMADTSHPAVQQRGQDMINALLAGVGDSKLKAALQSLIAEYGGTISEGFSRVKEQTKTAAALIPPALLDGFAMRSGDVATQLGAMVGQFESIITTQFQQARPKLFATGGAAYGEVLRAIQEMSSSDTTVAAAGKKVLEDLLATVSDSTKRAAIQTAITSIFTIDSERVASTAGAVGTAAGDAIATNIGDFLNSEPAAASILAGAAGLVKRLTPDLPDAFDALADQAGTEIANGIAGFLQTPQAATIITGGAADLAKAIHDQALMDLFFGGGGDLGAEIPKGAAAAITDAAGKNLIAGALNTLGGVTIPDLLRGAMKLPVVDAIGGTVATAFGQGVVTGVGDFLTNQETATAAGVGKFAQDVADKAAAQVAAAGAGVAGDLTDAFTLRFQADVPALQSLAGRITTDLSATVQAGAPDLFAAGGAAAQQLADGLKAMADASNPQMQAQGAAMVSALIDRIADPDAKAKAQAEFGMLSGTVTEEANKLAQNPAIPAAGAATVAALAKGITDNMATLQASADAMAKTYTDALDKIKAANDAMRASQVGTGPTPTAPTQVGGGPGGAGLATTGASLADQLANGYMLRLNLDLPALLTLSGEFLSDITDTFTKANPTLFAAGSQAATSLASGLRAASDSTASPEARQAGIDTVLNLLDGIKDSTVAGQLRTEVEHLASVVAIEVKQHTADAKQAGDDLAQSLLSGYMLRSRLGMGELTELSAGFANNILANFSAADPQFFAAGGAAMQQLQQGLKDMGSLTNADARTSGADAINALLEGVSDPRLAGLLRTAIADYGNLTASELKLQAASVVQPAAVDMAASLSEGFRLRFQLDTPQLVGLVGGFTDNILANFRAGDPKFFAAGSDALKQVSDGLRLMASTTDADARARGADMVSAMLDGISDPKIKAALQTAIGDLSTVTTEEIKRLAAQAVPAGEALAQSLLSGYTLRLGLDAPALATLATGFVGNIVANFTAANPTLFAAGSDAAKQLGLGLQEMANTTNAQTRQDGTDIINALLEGISDPKLAALLRTAISDYGNVIAAELKRIAPATAASGVEMAQGFMDAFATRFRLDTGQLGILANQFANNVSQNFALANPTFFAAGSGAMQQLIDGLQMMGDTADATARQRGLAMVNALLDTITDPKLKSLIQAAIGDYGSVISEELTRVAQQVIPPATAAGQAVANAVASTVPAATAAGQAVATAVGTGINAGIPTVDAAANALTANLGMAFDLRFTDTQGQLKDLSTKLYTTIVDTFTQADPLLFGTGSQALDQIMLGLKDMAARGNKPLQDLGLQMIKALLDGVTNPALKALLQAAIDDYLGIINAAAQVNPPPSPIGPGGGDHSGGKLGGYGGSAGAPGVAATSAAANAPTIAAAQGGNGTTTVVTYVVLDGEVVGRSVSVHQATQQLMRSAPGVL